jgi:hypothetical protein
MHTAPTRVSNAASVVILVVNRGHDAEEELTLHGDGDGYMYISSDSLLHIQ